MVTIVLVEAIVIMSFSIQVEEKLGKLEISFAWVGTQSIKYISKNIVHKGAQ